MKYLRVNTKFKPHNHYIAVIIIQNTVVSKNYDYCQTERYSFS
jgi:hypothetical protein